MHEATTPEPESAGEDAPYRQAGFLSRFAEGEPTVATRPSRTLNRRIREGADSFIWSLAQLNLARLHVPEQREEHRNLVLPVIEPESVLDVALEMLGADRVIDA